MWTDRAFKLYYMLELKLWSITKLNMSKLGNQNKKKIVILLIYIKKNGQVLQTLNIF